MVSEPPSMASSTPLTFSQAHHFISIILSSKNFVHWKTQLEPFLQAHNLYRFLDGTFPRPCLEQDATSPPSDTQSSSSSPSPTPTQEDLTRWDQTDALLRSLLISSLTEEVLPLVVGKTTSQAIWSALHHAYASTSNSRILSLRLALQDLTQKSDEPVATFLQRAKAISDELSASGHPLQPLDFNLHVFRALRPDFREIVPVLMGTADPLSFDDLHARLTSHEFLLNSHLKQQLSQATSPAATPTSTPPTAHATSAPGGQFRPPSRGRGRGGSRGRGPPQPDRPWCSICHRSNHTAATCYHRPPAPGFPPPYLRPSAPPLLPTPPSWPPAPQAHMTHPQLAAPSPPGSWFPDTGATHHVTANLQDLHLILLMAAPIK